jgi:hypothetical protein
MPPIGPKSASPLSVPVKASERIEAMMKAEHIKSSALQQKFLLQLEKIEEIESRLGREDIDKKEWEALVNLCHQILNEVQELHLRSYLEHAYVHNRFSTEI